jgi:hypothetical protein
MKKIYAWTFIAALVVTAAVFTACPTDAGGGGDETFTITNAAEWSAALNKINNGGNGKSYVLTIAGSFDVPYKIGYTFTAYNLTVTFKGSGTLSLPSTGRLFFFSGSTDPLKPGWQKLIIDGNITLNGLPGNISPVIEISNDASLELKQGTITGNTYATGQGGGVFVNSGGAFTMSGGTITGNTASYGGGGVYVGGTFTMTGGSIRDNTVTYTGGGGVLVSGAFTMTGGTISGNTVTGSSGYGGGVRVNSGGSFSKSGGTIYGKDGGANSNTVAGGDNYGYAGYINGTAYDMTQ